MKNKVENISAPYRVVQLFTKVIERDITRTNINSLECLSLNQFVSLITVKNNAEKNMIQNKYAIEGIKSIFCFLCHKGLNNIYA